MTKKSSKKPPAFSWKGYVNISIPESRQNDCENYILDTKQVFAEMNGLLIKDYTIKFHIDAKTDAFKCTLTCYSPDDPNFGHAMSAYADSWTSALGVVLYKHHEIADCDWTDFQAVSKRSFG